MNWITGLAAILVIVGGLNWGLIGFFKWDLVAAILGKGDQQAPGPRVVYAIVGLASIWLIFASVVLARRL